MAEQDYITRHEFDQYAQKMDAENTRQNHRIDAVEKTAEKITDLTVAVNRMAVSMEQMVTEQKSMGERLKVIEDAPKENAKTVRAAVVSAICGAVATAIVAAILTLL